MDASERNGEGQMTPLLLGRGGRGRVVVVVYVIDGGTCDVLGWDAVSKMNPDRKSIDCNDR